MPPLKLWQHAVGYRLRVTALMSFRNSLNHFFKVASFAIDNLWPVGRVAGLEGIRAALGHTLACPEAQGVALLEPLVVAAVGASTGQRQVHSAIKSKLGWEKLAILVHSAFLVCIGHIIHMLDNLWR